MDYICGHHRAGAGACVKNSTMQLRTLGYEPDVDAGGVVGRALRNLWVHPAAVAHGRFDVPWDARAIEPWNIWWPASEVAFLKLLFVDETAPATFDGRASGALGFPHIQRWCNRFCAWMRGPDGLVDNERRDALWAAMQLCSRGFPKAGSRVGKWAHLDPMKRAAEGEDLLVISAEYVLDAVSGLIDAPLYRWTGALDVPWVTSEGVKVHGGKRRRVLANQVHTILAVAGLPEDAPAAQVVDVVARAAATEDPAREWENE